MIFFPQIICCSRETQNTNLDFAEDFFSSLNGGIFDVQFFFAIYGLVCFFVSQFEELFFKNRNFLQILLRFFYDFFFETLFTFSIIGNFDAKIILHMA